MRLQIDFYVYRFVGGNWVLIETCIEEAKAVQCAMKYPQAKVIKTVSEVIW